MKVIDKFAQFLLAICVPALLLIGAVKLISSPAYVTYEYNKASFPPDTFGFSPENRLEYATAALEYVSKPLPAEFLASQTDGGQPLYNERELSHMVDVQNVFQGVWKAGLAAGLLFILASSWLLSAADKRKGYLRILQTSGFATAVGLILVGFLAYVGWDTWFTLFHKLFFLPGSWQFNFSDTLIRLFPTQFWFDSAVAVTGSTAAAGLVLALAARIIAKKVYSPAAATSKRRKSIAQKPDAGKPARREWPLSIYGWMLGMALAGYMIGMFAFGDTSHPMHWVSAIFGLAFGIWIGWALVYWKENRGPVNRK